jgi:hypothetical protein
MPLTKVNRDPTLNSITGDTIYIDGRYHVVD